RCARTSVATRHVTPSDEIEQRKKKNPDDVDEVPVEAAYFERRVILRCETTAVRHDRKHGEQADSDDHVQSVQTGHKEIKAEEHGHVLAGCAPFRTDNEAEAGNQMLNVIVVPFKSKLDGQEGGSQDHGGNQKSDLGSALADLRRMDGESHGQ